LSPTDAPASPWFDALLAGRKSPLGEALSLVEAGGAPARALLARLHARGGRAQIIGVTGPPGSGKSTLVNELALHFASLGRRVGIVAVDPTSPFTGGALLGDRIRMNAIAKSSLAGQGDIALTYAVNSMLVKEYINNEGKIL